MFLRSIQQVLKLSTVSCVMSAAMATAQSFTAPAAATSTQMAIASNGAQTLAIAVDAAGNQFFTTPGAGSFVENPANGGAQITLIATSLSYPKGVAVDNKGFAYTTDYHGHLWQVPAGGGTAVDILPSCNSLDGYYLGTQAVAVDGSNNVYTAGNNLTALFKITPAGVCSIVAGVTLDSNSHVAADAAGNLIYSKGGVLYNLPAGAAAPVAVAHTFDAINGLRSDAFGNLFVSTNSTITEVPVVNGILSAAQTFAVLPYSSSYDVGIGPDGSIYSTTDGTNIVRSFLGSAQFGTTTVNMASAVQTVNVLFNSAQTLASIRYASGTAPSTEITNTGAGNCAIGLAYSAGTSCTLTLTDTPSTIGVRDGAVVLSSATATVGQVFVSEEGSGAGLVADPGTQTVLGSGFTTPDGIAVGAAGGLAVSDGTAGTVSFFAPGATTATAIATGLTQPAGLALAPDGSVYVANKGANNIVTVPYNGAAYGATTIAVSGLKAPSAVAFASNGDLYIANTGAGNVLRVPNQGGSLNLLNQAALATTFTAPSGLAFDRAGDLFVTDSSAGTITEIINGAASVIVSGLTSPGAVAVDDSGTLYVQQLGVPTILRVPFTSGAYNTNATSKLSIGLTTPASLAADSAGNLYLADSGAASVVQIQRTAGTLNFGRVNVGASSGSQSETLSNDGDLSAALGSPLYTAAGNTADFAISTGGTGGCAAGGTLIPGSTCSLSGVFSPTATGTRTDTFTFNSNAVNASPITVAFTGAGVNLATPTVTLTQTAPVGAVTFGQTVTLNATVSAASGTPTGTVQFSVNGVAYNSAVPLTNGAATISITGLAAGTDTITATYSGDANFASSTGQALTVPVALVKTTTTLVSTISSAVPVPPGTSATLTATIVSSLASGQPTGTVTFTTGTTTLGTISLNAAGVATLTTTALPTGTYSIVATYSGDSGFAGSSSSAVTVAVLAPTYILSNTPSTLTVSTPGSASTSFVVTPISGYTGGVDMSCSGLPANTQCNFAPAVVYFTNIVNGTTTITPGPQTITLTVTTATGPTTTVAAWLLPFGSLMLLAGWRSRKSLPGRGLLCTLLLVVGSGMLLLSASGCSSPFANTPKGTSNVVVNFVGTPTGLATAPLNGVGNLPNSFNFSLTVQ